MSPESYQQDTLRSLQPSNGNSPLQPRIWEVAPPHSAPLRSVPLSSMQFQSAATTSYTPPNGLIEQLYNAIDDRSTVDKFTTKYEDQLDGGGLLLAIGIGCIAIGATVSSLFTSIYDYNHPKYSHIDPDYSNKDPTHSYIDLYNCIGILNCHQYANTIITDKTLSINWEKPPQQNDIYIPYKEYAYYSLQNLSAIIIPNLTVTMQTSSMYINDYINSTQKNVYILFIKNIGTFGSVYDSYAIRIVMCWYGIDSSLNNSSFENHYVKISKLLIIDKHNLMEFNHTNKGVVGTLIPRINGGSRRGTKKSQKKSSKAVAKWVSTGERVTLPDGKVRTVYRNERTGKVGVRKMVKRAGKKVAVYKPFKKV
jgi:hypothetical protein